MTRTIGGDLAVDGRGNLVIEQGLEAVRQRVLQRLHFVRGEWFLSESDGVPYYQDIFGQPYGEGLAARVIASEVSNVAGVDNVEVVSSFLDSAGRRLLHLVLRVETSFGPLTIEADL